MDGLDLDGLMDMIVLWLIVSAFYLSDKMYRYKVMDWPGHALNWLYIYWFHIAILIIALIFVVLLKNFTWATLGVCIIGGGVYIIIEQKRCNK